MRQSGDMASQRPPQEPGAAARSRPASVEFMEMMDRAVAVADAEAIGGRDRRADPGLGFSPGAPAIAALIQVLALRTARSRSSPLASPAATAEDSEQPVPWVLRVATRGAASAIVVLASTR